MSHLQGDPADRVAREEAEKGRHLADHKASFSGTLMTYNTQVTLASMALGMSFGTGTIVLMVYNGVMLGALAVDYVMAGQTSFPPRLADAAWRGRDPGDPGRRAGGVRPGGGDDGARPAAADDRVRLREAAPDVVTLCFGAALMLVWAGNGTVEAFFSQYHEPVIPYAVKIAFGAAEFAALSFLPSPAAAAGSGRPRRAYMSPARLNTLRVRTPEGVSFVLPDREPGGPPGRARRRLGQVVSSAWSPGRRPREAPLADQRGLLRAWSGSSGISSCRRGYRIVAEWKWRGQTVGKRLLRLRVVDEDGRRLTFQQVTMRNLLRFVDALPVAYMVAGVAATLSRKGAEAGRHGRGYPGHLGASPRARRTSSR